MGPTGCLVLETRWDSLCPYLPGMCSLLTSKLGSRSEKLCISWMFHPDVLIFQMHSSNPVTGTPISSEMVKWPVIPFTESSSHPQL